MFKSPVQVARPALRGDEGSQREPSHLKTNYSEAQMNQPGYGDLQVLREHIATESVDLIYLEPPFNSHDYSRPVVGRQELIFPSSY